MKLTREQTEEIVHRHDYNGETYTKLAQEYEVSLDTIMRARKRYGLRRDGRKRRSIFSFLKHK